MQISLGYRSSALQAFRLWQDNMLGQGWSPEKTKKRKVMFKETKKWDVNWCQPAEHSGCLGCPFLQSLFFHGSTFRLGYFGSAIKWLACVHRLVITGGQMPDPVVSNFATNRISEGRNAPTGSKFSRNLCVLSAFKYQTSIFCEYNFSGNSGLWVEKCHPVYASYYITNLYQQHIWWCRLLFLPLHHGIMLQYLDLRNEFKVETSLFLV